MSKVKIEKNTIKFLKDIAKNNNRPWFAENKDRYVAAKKNMDDFGNALMNEMEKHDEIAQAKIYRIYRDVRFSKDKVPYKKSLSGYLERATKWKRGGYYFHIEPGEYFLGGGFWNPNSDDLKRIRQEIAINDTELRGIITDKKFTDYFGALEGNKLKTAPRGFEKDHPAVDLLRYKQYLVMHKFTEKEVLADDFLEKVVDGFRNMRPFFDYMSDVLTTDLNGLPLWEE